MISSSKRLIEFFSEIKDLKNFTDEEVLKDFDDLEEDFPQTTIHIIFLSIEKHRPGLFKTIIDRLNDV